MSFSMGSGLRGALRQSVLALLLAFGSCESGVAAPKTPMDDLPPMRFTVVRSNEAACEPVCPEWIAAEGAVVADTPVQFRRVLKELRGRPLPIFVHSPGGNVDAAMQLGRMIRKAKLNVAVARTFFAGCQPADEECKANAGKASRFIGYPYAPAGACNSACPLILAGGVERIAGPKAFVGVHQITTVFTQQKIVYKTTYKMVKGKRKILDKKIVSRKDAGSYTTYEMNKSMERRLAAYLAEMGVSREILEMAKATPASSIRQVALWDMFRNKLVTGSSDVSALAAGTLCRKVPAPDNCRLFTISDLQR